MHTRRIDWKNEVEELRRLTASGMGTTEIGKLYEVSPQRIYQVLTKFGISTPVQKQKNFLVGKGPEVYWLNRMLTSKGFSKEERLHLTKTLHIPEKCPMLGLTLEYGGVGKGPGWTREENSPSLDKIDPLGGYTADNIHIISWRANRIKNDGTVEEIGKIYNYLLKIIK